ncbi:MAG: acyl-CoA thioesterase [Oscillospiraceae bacterium]|nr:acyl-CoA thioesterase [Oscillospiraceae bacterium]
MYKTESKRVEDSRTETVQIVMSGDTSHNGRLFGGRLLEWIDIVAAVVARRHSGSEVTTVSIDNLSFKAPAYASNTVVLIGQVTYVGRTSIEIKVETFVENLHGERKIINTAYVVMVALDGDERPSPVPALRIESEAQGAEFEAGKRRHELRKQRREDLSYK